MKAELTEQYVLKLRRDILQPVVEKINARAWLVGGCVRDIIHHEGINDIDILCTDASQLVSTLDNYFNETNVDHSIHTMENGHATVISVLSKHIFGEFPILPVRFNIEVSQLDKLDMLDVDGALVFDSLSRDFVCNSWYIDVAGDGKPFNLLIDESSVYDASGKYIYPCHEYITIYNNPLRIYRALDLMCRGYKPTVQLTYAIDSFLRSDRNKKIYKESCLQVIHKVFCRLASGEYKVTDVIYAFDYFAELGAWEMIHPVFKSMLHCIHNNHYHHDSVWLHTMNVIYNMAIGEVRDDRGELLKPDEFDFWAAFLHDTGKVTTISYDLDGNTHFYDHQTKSVEFAAEILKDSPLDKNWTNYVLNIIAHHMDTKSFGNEPIKVSQYKHIRKLQWELGSRGFTHFLILNDADCAASERSENNNTYNVVRSIKDMAYNRGETAWEIYKIPVTGDDIKDAFPDEPGVNIGKYIKQLYKVTFSRPEDYETKEQCLHYVGTLIKTGWAKKSHKNS